MAREAMRWSSPPRRVVVVAFAALSCKSPPPSRSDAGAAPSASAVAAASSAKSVSSAVDVASGASVASWDAAADPVRAGGEVDGAALMKKHRARLAADKSPVAILQGGTAVELGARLCEAVVPKRDAATPVLIKPNMGGMEWFKDPAKSDGDDGVVGRVTDAEFVRGIVRCLKARGHKAITLADGFGHTHASWQRLARVTGMETVAREEGVRLVAFDDDGVFDVEGDRPGLPLAIKGIDKTHVPTLLMPKVLAEHLERGLFISAPKVKAHRFSVFSVAAKGMQGVVQYADKKPAVQQKWRSHKELGEVLSAIKKNEPDARQRYVAALEIFAERMTDLLELAAPDVVLAEGLPAMGGDGFGKQWPAADRFVVGGTNPILVDRVAAELLGFWNNAALGKELLGHTTSPLLTVAAKRFGVDIAAPAVTGDGAKLLGAPRPFHLEGMAGFSLHSDQTPRTPPRVDAGSMRDAGTAPVDAGAASAAEVRARYSAVDPVLDGTLTDAPWKAASERRFDTDWAGAPTGTATTVRAAWNERGLYVAFSLDDAGLFVDRTRDRSVERTKLYEEDCVELMIAPDAADRTRYFEIEVGPLGHYFDLLITRSGKASDVGWSGGLAIGTANDPSARTASVEVAVRADDVRKVLRRGARLPLGVYRMEGQKPRKYLALFPTRTPKPNFHVPEAFGTLVLE